MDKFLGFEGQRISDLPITPGRGKVVWQPSDRLKITYEQTHTTPTHRIGTKALTTTLIGRVCGTSDSFQPTQFLACDN
jgi:hypothetical protein